MQVTICRGQGVDDVNTSLAGQRRVEPPAWSARGSYAGKILEASFASVMSSTQTFSH